MVNDILLEYILIVIRGKIHKFKVEYFLKNFVLLSIVIGCQKMFIKKIQKNKESLLTKKKNKRIFHFIQTVVFKNRGRRSGV